MRLDAPAPAIPAAVQKVADHYRADLVALGAAEVVAKPAGVLVLAPDATRGSTLAALLDASPHELRLQVAAGSSASTPATLDAAAIVDAVAGARLAGVTAVSWSDGSTTMGMRTHPMVRLHVTGEQRAAELNELLRPNVSMVVEHGVPQPDSGVSLRATIEPAPKPGPIVQVRELPAS